LSRNPRLLSRDPPILSADASNLSPKQCKLDLSPWGNAANPGQLWNFAPVALRLSILRDAQPKNEASFPE
jgi:hypothetical protein